MTRQARIAALRELIKRLKKKKLLESKAVLEEEQKERKK